MAIMAEYRCYFSTKPLDNDNASGGASSIHILRLDSDDAARLTAEEIRDACEHIRSFEIWQGERLVHASAGIARPNEPLPQLTALSA